MGGPSAARDQEAAAGPPSRNLSHETLSVAAGLCCHCPPLQAAGNKESGGAVGVVGNEGFSRGKRSPGGCPALAEGPLLEPAQGGWGAARPVESAWPTEPGPAPARGRTCLPGELQELGSQLS